MEKSLIEELSKFDSRITKIESEIHNLDSKKTSYFIKEEYISSECKKYIGINFSKNQLCLKGKILIPPGFDISISDNTILPMLVELN